MLWKINIKVMENFNTKIVSEIIKHSSGKNPVIYLMKLFPMSRETAYRRLRNKIPFSVEELVAIAEDFDLSIDQLLDLKSGDNFPFNKGLNIEKEPIDIYSSLLENDIEIMGKLLASKNVKIAATINRIPFRFLPFKSLFKFDYCHNMYLAGRISMMNRYSDIIVPPDISDLHEKCASRFSKLSNIICIIDSQACQNIIRKIQYYYRLRFLSPEDLKILQAELFEFLKMLEGLLRTGKNSIGSNYVFYYSFFNVESNVAFYEYDNNSLLQIWIYPDSPIALKNNAIINVIQKKWIDAKIRNSMLITKTTDIHQIEMLRNMYTQISEIANYEF